MVDSFVGIFQNGQTMFNIYPNPSKGIFNVQFNDNIIGEKSVNIFDLTGRLVYNTVLNNEKDCVIDISNKDLGTYVLKISVNENQYIKRITNIK